MPRHFISFLKYNSPWLCIEGDPPSGDPPGGGGGETPADPPGGGGSGGDDLQKQIDALKSELTGKDALIGKLRGVERQQKAMEAILGETNPEKLQKLRDAEANLAQEMKAKEDAVIQARNEVTQDFSEKLEIANKDKKAAEVRAASVETKFDLFRAFGANGGIGSRFEAFINLTSGNFERDTKGALQVRDDAGELVIFSSDDGDRAATPGDFIKMINTGKLEKYTFNQLEMIQFTLEAYNKASGAGLPNVNGHGTSQNIQKMSQSELSKVAFR